MTIRHRILAQVLLVTSFLWLDEARAQIDHLEPPFWWAGLNDPSLQLMVHGTNASEWSPEIDFPGIKILSVTKVENPNYLFIDLLVTTPSEGTFRIDFRRGRKSVARYDYQLRAREPGSSGRQGFTNSDAMYLITPDRFVNGNPDNDNLEGLLETANREDPGGRHGGDIEGIMRSLDHIAKLGFTAIWVNPVLENNQPSFSYHGYSTTDYYRVDPRYGTNQDYVDLSKMARQKGMKVIMDMITNHCGSEHWWMSDLPTSDWVNFDNQFVPTNHRKSAVQDPYRSEYDYRRLVDGWFVETMPDLNHRNELLAKYLIQNTIWWIEYAGLQGIRMDTYPYNDMDFMTDWTCAVMSEYPNFNITGEEWHGNPLIVGFWQKGNKAGYESCLPSMLDFPLGEAIKKSLVEDKEGKGFDASYEMLANDFYYADPNNFVVFPDNHDMDRFFTQVNEDLDLFKLGIAYFATVRGIPQIYYGTELVMSNSVLGDHGLIRGDYPGGWEADAVNAFTGRGLSAQQKEALEFVSLLFNWRQSAEVVHSGKLMHFAPDNDVYVLFRFNDQEKIMVVLNRSRQGRTLQMDRFGEMTEGVSGGLEVITGKRMQLAGQLDVPARTALILELD